MILLNIIKSPFSKLGFLTIYFSCIVNYKYTLRCRRELTLLLIYINLWCRLVYFQKKRIFIIMIIFSSLQKKYFLSIGILLLSSLSLLSSQAVFAASEDAYLRQLELEAGDELEEVPLDTVDSADSDELIQNKTELITDQKSFEKALKGKFQDSFELYRTMDDKQKNKIYQEYRRHKRLYNSSVKIISIYLSTH